MSKILIGKVVSTKMPKTVTVEVESRQPHPLYKKIVKRVKKYKVHNENLEVQPGDRVRIQETRPISKDKHFKVIEVIKREEIRKGQEI